MYLAYTSSEIRYSVSLIHQEVGYLPINLILRCNDTFFHSSSNTSFSSTQTFVEIADPCAENNGGCSDRCLRDIGGSTHCECDSGRVLDSNGLTCSSEFAMKETLGPYFFENAR